MIDIVYFVEYTPSIKSVSRKRGVLVWRARVLGEKKRGRGADEGLERVGGKEVGREGKKKNISKSSRVCQH